ncbi:MAG: tyrosine--tRNA ligase [bacterium]|nr:tyrosine--tRNA ligase [bacterium]
MSTRTGFEELQARGFVSQVTNETAIRELFTKPPVSFYVGFDPTATSMHIGNMVPICAMAHLQRCGNRPVILVGGATGMIGDPSGRTSERVLLTLDKVAENLASIRTQFERFFSFEGPNAAIIVNNYDWTSKFSYIDWLRDVGKNFTINYMLQKKSVKMRLDDREQGLSYTEFSYMLLQAYDFLHLYDHEKCQLQCGADDQWGNITAGTDLIRRMRGVEAYGITFPLLLTSEGEKLGKSTGGGSVWLDPKQTSPYHFYQYWIQVPDADVGRMMKMFTFLSVEEIDEIVAEHLAAPEKRYGQIRLATEVTRTVHGEEGLQKAQLATDVLFGKPIAGLNDDDLAGIFADVPAFTLARSRLDEGLSIIDLAVEAGAYPSKGEARRAITSGGCYLNNHRVSDVAKKVTSEDLIATATMILRTGKKNYFLIRVK